MANSTTHTSDYSIPPSQLADLDSIIQFALLEARCSRLKGECEILKAEVDALRRAVAISPDALMKRINRRLAKGYPFWVLKAARPEDRGSLGRYYLLSHSAQGWNFEYLDVDLISLAEELGIICESGQGPSKKLLRDRK